jgi:hypothetical protein
MHVSEDQGDTTSRVLPIANEDDLARYHLFESSAADKTACALPELLGYGPGDHANECYNSPFSILTRFRNPLDSMVCTGAFGERRGSAVHLGMDFHAPVGAPIRAVASGRVLYAGYLPCFSAFGRIVVIDHGANAYTLYGHVDPRKELLQPRRKGERYRPIRVTAGTQIASIGYHKPGESSSGPHLHLEILVINKAGGSITYTFHNPALYLPMTRTKKDLYPVCKAAYRSESRKLARLQRCASLEATRLRGLRGVLWTLSHTSGAPRMEPRNSGQPCWTTDALRLVMTNPSSFQKICSAVSDRVRERELGVSEQAVAHLAGLDRLKQSLGSVTPRSSWPRENGPHFPARHGHQTQAWSLSHLHTWTMDMPPSAPYTQAEERLRLHSALPSLNSTHTW